MKTEWFEDIEAWQLARKLIRKLYRLTKKPGFVKDYGLKKQIQDAAGSSMINIDEGFDADMNPPAARLFVDSSPISRNMKSAKRPTVNPEPESLPLIYFYTRLCSRNCSEAQKTVAKREDGPIW